MICGVKNNSIDQLGWQDSVVAGRAERLLVQRPAAYYFPPIYATICAQGHLLVAPFFK